MYVHTSSAFISCLKCFRKYTHTLTSSSKENNIRAVARNMDASHVFAGQAILLIVRDGTRDMECDQRGESERPSKKPPTLFQPSCFVGGGE